MFSNCFCGEEKLCFFDVVTVPITVSETVYREYENVPITRSEDEAKTEAYRELRARCAEVAKDSELVSREISSGMRDGKYVIECELTVIKDIAVEVPIYTAENTGGN